MLLFDCPQVFDRVVVPGDAAVDQVVVHPAQQHQVAEVPQLFEVLAVPFLVPGAAGLGTDDVGDLADPGALLRDQPR
ncbi:hypothetical protein [Streptomyces arboris]|uniref:hypothetical protein n=1 Tax=Streptomyces arboris TaxID=2600619 RepID=UPI003626C7BA